MSRFSNMFFIALLSLGMCLAVLPGCGGGTSGTGLGSFDGQVKSVTGDPVAGAIVTITSTGETAVTDSQGHFFLKTAVDAKDVEFLVEANGFEATFVVAEVSSVSATQISLDVVLDPVSNSIQVANFSLEASIVGGCAAYFDVGETILQTTEVPVGSVCNVRAVLKGDGVLRADIPIALQYRSCRANGRNEWKTLATGTTQDGDRLGVVRFAFEYNDSRTFCRYRVVGPHEYGDYRAVDYEIETLAAQRLQRDASR